MTTKPEPADADLASREEEPAPVVATPSRVFSLDGLLVREEERPVAVEEPVQVAFSDVTFAVMMLTPADLVDFAYGFSLTEGVIERFEDIRDVEVTRTGEGTLLRVALRGDTLHRHLARQRAMVGRTGCGICGIDDIAALRRAGPSPTRSHAALRIPALKAALEALDERQVLNLQTRAVHAAAWADADGAILHVREDVGRHNALDKLIGALVRGSVDPASGFVLITSRCSFEMVEKTVVFGAKALVAISAPTSLAIARAQALDLALIAIARRDTLTVFNGAERLLSS